MGLMFLGHLHTHAIILIIEMAFPCPPLSGIASLSSQIFFPTLLERKYLFEKGQLHSKALCFVQCRTFSSTWCMHCTTTECDQISVDYHQEWNMQKHAKIQAEKYFHLQIDYCFLCTCRPCLVKGQNHLLIDLDGWNLSNATLDSLVAMTKVGACYNVYCMVPDITCELY